MRTAVVDVGDLLSVQSALGVEKQRRLPGVERVEVSAVARSATAEFDEKAIDLRRIKERIRECGHHCRGEIVPKHLFCRASARAPLTSRRCSETSSWNTRST